MTSTYGVKILSILDRVELYLYPYTNDHCTQLPIDIDDISLYNILKASTQHTPAA